MNAHDPRLSIQIAIARSAVDLIRQYVDPDDPDFVALVEAETDALDTLRQMLRAARYAEADAKKLGEMIGEMRDRKTRFEEKAEGFRRSVAWALEELGMKRLDAPDFTATLAAGRPNVVITDDALLPDELCRIKREPDKAKVREFLEGGLELQGATLGNSKTVLTMRVR